SNGPLNWRSIQDSLAAIHAESVAAGVEMGGIIWAEYAKGPFYFMRLTATSASNCHWSFTGSGSVPGAIMGYFHTHLYRDGDQFSCPGDSTGTVRTATNSLTGGGSVDISDSTKGDWGFVRTAIPPRKMYIVDPDFLWRLDPGTPIGQESSNPNQWSR